VLLIVTLLAGQYVYNKYLDWTDQEKFNIVKANVETIASRLQAADPSIKWGTEARCSLPGVKFQNGDASCHVSTEAKFKVTSIDQVKSVLDAYYNLLDGSKDIIVESQTTGPRYPNFTRGLDVDTDKLMGLGVDFPFSGEQFYLDKTTSTQCGLESSIIHIDTQAALDAYFSCGGLARDTYFYTPDKE
jgi:hypothetical protein